MDENEEFKRMMNFFEHLFGHNKPKPKAQNLDDIPFYSGVCNCCLRKTKGQHLYYQYKGTNKPTQLFICEMCRGTCPPEHPFCLLNGCSLSATYQKYVTNESKKSPYS